MRFFVDGGETGVGQAGRMLPELQVKKASHFAFSFNNEVFLSLNFPMVDLVKFELIILGQRSDEPLDRLRRPRQ